MPDAPASARHPWYSWRRLGLNFLTISVLAHLLFGVGATYFVVQTIQAKRKQNFVAPSTGPSAPTRALEHKVQMQKKKQTMSAPAPVKRITTTSNAKVALPAMPAMPHRDAAIQPLSMAGMGGTGTGFGMSGGGGAGSGTGSGLGNFIGSLRPQAGVVGTFYDLKQTPQRQPTNMNTGLYARKVIEFVKGNFNQAVFSPYYKASKPVYATRIFTPDIDAKLGPAAFGVEKEVEPKMWVVVYKATVRAPESGTIRFAGQGDDILYVRFNNKVVLEASLIDNQLVPGVTHSPWSWLPKLRIGLSTGVPCNVEAGQSYPIEVLIGEQPGGRIHAVLFVQKEGETYKKDPLGNNILPIFRTKDEPLLPLERGMSYPPYAEGGAIWPATAAAGEFSVFSH